MNFLPSGKLYCSPLAVQGDPRPLRSHPSQSWSGCSPALAESSSSVFMNYLLHSSLSCDIKCLTHTSWFCAHKGQNGPPCFEMILVGPPPAEHQPEKGADSSGPTYKMMALLCSGHKSYLKMQTAVTLSEGLPVDAMV